jgi:iron(III) transport system substrate-binding protein
MTISRRIFLGGAAAASVVGIGKIKETVFAQNKQINIYSSRHYNTDSTLYNTFTDLTGIKVNLVEGKDDELIERIKTEGRNSPADILIAVDAGRLWRADQAGLFAPVNSTILQQQIPASLRHPQGHWFGFSKRARVIVYNKNKVSKSQLSTYEDLATSKWKGKIVVRSSTNVYNQSLVGALIAIHGEKKTEDWCRGLVANFARPPQGGDTDQIKAVAAGIADLAIVNTYYVGRLGQSDKKDEQEIFKQVGIFFPNQNARGTHVNISGGGLIKTSKNRTNAIKFLEYLAGSTAQKFFAQGNNEYPVVANTPIDPIMASFGTFKSDTINVALYGQNSGKAVQIMDRAGWK